MGGRGVVRFTEKARLPGWLFLLFYYPCERFVMITNGGGFSEEDGRWNRVLFLFAISLCRFLYTAFSLAV